MDRGAAVDVVGLLLVPGVRVGGGDGAGVGSDDRADTVRREPRPAGARYSSTRLRYALDNCPYALDLYEAGAPYERGHFEVGIAAHAVIQAVAQETNRQRRALSDDEIQSHAERATQALIAGPRVYDRNEEPPIHPDHAIEGRELALDWLIGIERPEPGAEIEVGLALDRDGRSVDYWSGDAYHRDPGSRRRRATE